MGFPSARRAAALAAALLWVGPPAAAQHPGLLPRVARSLHARLALADAVALATVERVEAGRIRMSDATPLAGSTPARFEIKRSPRRPPPLAEGDRALLLLRGARSPYVLVDAPEELVLVPGASAEARWRRALEALLAAAERPDARAALYRNWLDAEDAALRQAAVVGLGEARPASADPALRARLRRLAQADASREVRGAARAVLILWSAAEAAGPSRASDGAGP